jgi:hypothetical protein
MAARHAEGFLHAHGLVQKPCNIELKGTNMTQEVRDYRWCMGRTGVNPLARTGGIGDLLTQCPSRLIELGTSAT